MNRIVLRESIAVARSQKIVSSVSVILVAAVFAAVTLTAGRIDGAQNAVLATVEDQGLRTIIVRAEPAARLSTRSVDRISRIDGVGWVVGLTAATDTTNSRFPEGAKVPVRYVYGQSALALNLPIRPATASRSVYLSKRAMAAYGLDEPVGSVSGPQQRSVSVGGVASVPSALAFLEPVAVVPGDSSETPATLSLIVLTTRRTESVEPVTRAVAASLDTSSPDVSIESSRELAALSRRIDSQLSQSGRNLTAGMLATSGVLLGTLTFGFVVLRRRDFGRRRALGASRGLVIAMLMVTNGVLAVGGILIGAAASSAILAASDDPLPRPEFIIATAVITLATSLSATLLPAVVASRRDPISELRVP